MNRYIVSGYTSTYVYTEVEAESDYEARLEALEIGVRYWDTDASLTEPPVELNVEKVTS